MSTNGSADVSMEDVEDDSLAILEELHLGGEKKLRVVSSLGDESLSTAETGHTDRMIRTARRRIYPRCFFPGDA